MKVDLAFRSLSLAILAFQLYLPWSVKHFTTQDGPAHLYTAFVTKDLVFHRKVSPYHALYRVQKAPLPNWTCTLLLAGYLSLFGPDHAEAFLMTVCILAAYGSFVYFVGWRRGPPLLFANWLVQSWFLWAGFYNFYLGMALLPLALAVALRRRAVVSAFALILLFFTHLVPAILAVMALAILGVWTRREWRFAAALAPVSALIALYAFRFKGDTQFQPEMVAALQNFPQTIFVYSFGWMGEQRFLWMIVVLMILFCMFAMRRDEWKGLQGSLAISTGAAFLLYLVVPDIGFGGSVVKMRFALAVFLFGALLICSMERLRRWQTGLAMLLSFGLAAQLTLVASHVRLTSDAVEPYLAAMDQMPAGSRFVRMNAPAPYQRRQFELDRLAFNPLLHVDELGAVRRHAVALSDYQSATGTFSADLKPSIDIGRRHSLNFDDPRADAWASIPWLNEALPAKIDYVVYCGDDGPGDEAPVQYVGGTRYVRIFRLIAPS